MPKIDDGLKNLLGEAPGIGIDMGQNIARGMTPAKAAVGAVGDAIKAQILGPTGMVLGMMVGVSRVLGNMVKQADLFGRGISQMRSIEQMESKFQSILKSATLAKERMRELASMSLRSPFKLDELANASRNLSVLTRNAWASNAALSSLADASAATGADIGDLSVAFGKLFNYLRSGRSIQNVAYQLMATGAISGDLVDRLIEMQNAGAGFSQTWGAVTSELNKFQGAAKEEMSTLEGLTKRLEEMRNAAARAFGEGFVDAEKVSIYTSMKKVEMVTPLLKEVGSVVSYVSGQFNELKGSIAGTFYDAIKESGVLVKAFRTLGPLMAGLGLSTAGRVAMTAGGAVFGARKQFRENAKFSEAGASAGERLQREAKASNYLASRSFASGQEALFAFDLAAAAKQYATGAGQKAMGYGRKLGAAAASARAGAQAAEVAKATAPIAADVLAGMGKGAAVRAAGIVVLKDAWGLLTKAVMLAGNAVKGFFISIGPIGWVVTALGTGAAAFLLWKKQANEAAAATKRLVDATIESTKALRETVDAIRTAEDRAAALVKAYTELTEAKKRYNAAGSRKDQDIAKADVEEKQRIVQEIENTPVGGSLGVEDTKLRVQRRNYEENERPIAELQAQMQGASPEEQLRLFNEIQNERQRQEEAARAASEKERNFKQSGAGLKRASIDSRIEEISGRADASDEITELNKKLREQQDAESLAFRNAKPYAGAVASLGAVAARNADPAVIEARLAREETEAQIAKLTGMSGEEVKKHNNRKVAALKAEASSLQTPGEQFDAKIAAETKLAKEAQARARDAEALGLDSTTDRDAARTHFANAEKLAQDKLLEREAAAKYDSGGFSAEKAGTDEERKRLQFNAASSKIDAAVGEAENAASERGLDVELVGARARLSAAEAILRLTEKASKTDSEMTRQAMLRRDVEKQKLALLEAAKKDERTVANRGLQKAKLGNEITANLAGGQYESAEMLIPEAKKREMENELFDIRQGVFARGGSAAEADEAVTRRKNEMAEEMKAQEYEKLFGADSSPAGSYRRKMRDKVAGGMGAEQARQEAEAETLAEAKAAGKKYDAMDLSYDLSKSQGPLNTSGVDQFIGGLKVAKSATELAREGNKGSTAEKTLSVLTTLEQKIKEAEAVLVVK